MNKSGMLTSQEIKKLFTDGAVILFKCEARENLPLTYVSENCSEILGFNASHFLNKENGWTECIHPDDKEDAIDCLRRVLEHKEKTLSEYRFRKKDGTYIWLRDELKLIENEDGTAAILGLSFDITSLKRDGRPEGRYFQRRECKRLSYEQVISRCSILLLSNADRESIDGVLSLLLEAAGADRAYIFENYRDEDDNLCVRQIHEVCGSGVHSQRDNEGLQNIRYEHFPWWKERLSRNQVINRLVEDIPSPGKEALQSQDIKSILILPLFVDQDWYGFIGFDNVHTSELWGREEVALLKAASEIISTYKKHEFVQKSLTSQKNYTQAILDSLPSIYLAMNNDLEIVHWNKNAETLTGYSHSEIAAMSVFDFAVEGEHQKLIEATELLRQGEGTGVELKIRTKDEREVDFFWGGRLIKLGEEWLMLCVGLDITSQKEIRRELINEKRFSEAIIESLPGIFYMIDEQGQYLRWNENFEKQFGFSTQEISDMTFFDLLEENDIENVTREVQRVFEEGESSMEADFVTKDGTRIPYYMTGKRFNKDGQRYLIGSGYNISVQRRAMERLKKSEELFRNLFLKAPAAIVMVDVNNKVLMINQSFEKLFGYSESEIIEKDLDRVIVPPEEYDLVPKMPAIDFKGTHYYHQARRRTKDGKMKHVFVGSIPIYIDKKPYVGFGMYIDISEQVKYEKEISDSLKEKQVLLQEIHHRVKNNLAVISGLIQLQMYEVDDEYIRRILQESQSRIQTMALIHEKLYQSENLSRISCRTYIEELLQTLRNTFRTDTREINIKTEIEDIELNINKAVPFALLINEVISNTFEHAFTGRKQGAISVELFGKNGRIHVSIKDNGVGIPDEQSIDRKETLGMTLIYYFLKQLDAEWELFNKNGTTLKLAFSQEHVKGSSTTIV